MASSGIEPAMERRRVTIHDVARSAGVSRQTVSRALNDKAEIDGATKQRVLDAARELDYRPSRFARGLVRQDTTSIGLVIPDLRNPFFTEVAASALQAARERGWHVVVYDTADSAEQELGTLRNGLHLRDALQLAEDLWVADRYDIVGRIEVGLERHLLASLFEYLVVIQIGRI